MPSRSTTSAVTSQSSTRLPYSSVMRMQRETCSTSVAHAKRIRGMISATRSASVVIRLFTALTVSTAPEQQSGSRQLAGDTGVDTP